MIKKVSALLTRSQKIFLFFMLFGNFMIIGLEFLSLASVPIILSLILNPELDSSNIPFLNLITDNFTINEAIYKKLFLLLFFIFLFKNIFLALILYLEARFSYTLRTGLTNRLFKKYLELPYLFHANNNPGKLIRNVVDEVGNCCSVISQFLIVMREFLLITVITILLFIYNSLIIFPVIFFLGFLVFIFFRTIRKNVQSKGKITQIKRGIINNKVNELINGIKEIKVMNYQKNIFKKFKHEFNIAEFNSFFIKVINSFPKIILEMTGISLVVILYFIYDYLNYEIKLFLPILSLVAISSIRAIPSISALVVSSNNILFQLPSVNLVYKDLFKEKTDLSNQRNLKSFSFNKNIEIQNVSFKYPGRKTYILKDVSISIKKGKKIGLVGSSGSGKTTLLNLILGLIKPSKGKIMIDNKEIENLNQIEWRKQIGYISQNMFLMDDTIKMNITFGNKKISSTRFILALKKANLLRFIKSLPLKEKTLIGNNGIKISGGQHQRLGIARALFRNPKILIMDEATSALDYKTEDSIVRDLNLKKSDLTAIIVSHRPRSVQNCDIIYYLENGKVKYSGSFNKIYKKLKNFDFKKK